MHVDSTVGLSLEGESHSGAKYEEEISSRLHVLGYSTQGVMVA